MIYSVFGLGQKMVVLIVLALIALSNIIALIDILRSDFKDNNKIVWLLVVFFMNLLGAALYFIIGQKQKVK